MKYGIKDGDTSQTFRQQRIGHNVGCCSCRGDIGSAYGIFLACTISVGLIHAIRQLTVNCEIFCVQIPPTLPRLGQSNLRSDTVPSACPLPFVLPVGVGINASGAAASAVLDATFVDFVVSCCEYPGTDVDVLALLARLAPLL